MIRKANHGRRQPAQVQVAFERAHIDADRRTLQMSGSQAAASDAEAAMAVFTAGLGVLSGEYAEILAARLHDVQLRAFGPEGPRRFREAAMALHVSASLPDIATALLDGEPQASGGGPRLQ